jgi:lipoyl(octanoyl) transferase
MPQEREALLELQMLEKVLREDPLNVPEWKTFPNVEDKIDLRKCLDVDVGPPRKRQTAAADMEAERLGGIKRASPGHSTSRCAVALARTGRPAAGRLDPMPDAVAARLGLAIRRLGRVSYDAAMAEQERAAQQAAAGGHETLFLLEHEPVFTLGRNARREDILFTPERLGELSIAVRETDRGGKVTYHGPGQLVGYPILDLSPDRRDVKRYVTDLEEVLIRSLAEVGVTAERSPLRERVTSLWVGNDKIAAIGVHISRWITTHGFAVNVTDEPLENFRGIVPCGITDGGVTSIERVTGERIPLARLADAIVPHFAEVFGRDILGR